MLLQYFTDLIATLDRYIGAKDKKAEDLRNSFREFFKNIVTMYDVGSWYGPGSAIVFSYGLSNASLKDNDIFGYLGLYEMTDVDGALAVNTGKITHLTASSYNGMLYVHRNSLSGIISPTLDTTSLIGNVFDNISIAENIFDRLQIQLLGNNIKLTSNTILEYRLCTCWALVNTIISMGNSAPIPAYTGEGPGPAIMMYILVNKNATILDVPNTNINLNLTPI